MTFTVKEIDETSIVSLLVSEYGSSRNMRALRTTLLADHIRTLVWAPYLHNASVVKPVHTSRIYSALARNTEILCSLDVEQSLAYVSRTDEYEFVRDKLAQCGDIVRVGHGYWIPGPTRLFEISPLHPSVIISGAPTSALRRDPSESIRSIGPSRFLINSQAPSANYAKGRIEDWVGPIEPLAKWTEKTLSWAKSQLSNQAEIEDDSLEVYAPDVSRDNRLLGSWLDVVHFNEPAPTLRLFRPKMRVERSYDRPYYLGIFRCRPGGVQLTRAVKISRDTARRLRFGLDKKLNVLRTVSLSRHADLYHLKLRFALPQPEDRILGLTWRDADPEVLVFDEMALPFLEHVLNSLGIHLLHK